jgi:cell division septum initiation protein DivIVA
MTGGCCNIQPASAERKQLIIPQPEAKMNIDEIIDDLKQELQNMEDLKTQIAESQERIRQAICQCEMIKEGITK